MEIKRKKGRNKIKIEHNRKLFWTIVLLIIVLIALIYYIATKKEVAKIQDECKTDEDCVPVCGCHPEECVPASERGECPKVFCTQVCSGPLDCNAGSCRCVEGKCEVVSKE